MSRGNYVDLLVLRGQMVFMVVVEILSHRGYGFPKAACSEAAGLV